MKNNEKVKVSFWGFNYEAENLTGKGILIFILAVMLMAIITIKM